MDELKDWGMFGEDGGRGTIIGKGREAGAVASFVFYPFSKKISALDAGFYRSFESLSS